MGGWETLTIDADIRARVTDTGRLKLVEALPDYDNRVDAGEVEGKVVELSDVNLVLLVSGMDQAGFRRGELGQRLLLSRHDLLAFESKQLDGWKSGAMTAAAASVLAVFVLRQLTGFFGASAQGQEQGDRNCPTADGLGC
jgi:hypothetical protein